METILKIFICFLAGAGAGLGTGFAGMSAAAIIGPMLATFLGIPTYDAIGIGLASDVLASGISAYTYKKNKNLDVKNSLSLLIPVLVMTVTGSFVASLLPERAMNNTSQFMMIYLGFKFIINPIKTTKKQMKKMSVKERTIKSVLGGILVGFVCGFMGVGGGMMLLFVLTYLLEYEMHMAVGTSVFIMTFTALTGGISHFVIGGMPDITALLLCIVFTLIWARIAAKIANKVNAKTLNRLVGGVLIITSGIILLFKYIIH